MLSAEVGIGTPLHTLRRKDGSMAHPWYLRLLLRMLVFHPWHAELRTRPF